MGTRANPGIPLPTRLALLSIAAVLAGCAAHSHELIPAPGSPFVVGRIVHGAEADRLVLATHDRRFEGQFKATASQDWPALRERYQARPRRWDAVLAGLDRSDAVNEAEVALRAQDGEGLSCALSWPHAGKPAGTCAASGARFAVRFD